MFKDGFQLQQAAQEVGCPSVCPPVMHFPKVRLGNTRGQVFFSGKYGKRFGIWVGKWLGNWFGE